MGGGREGERGEGAGGGDRGRERSMTCDWLCEIIIIWYRVAISLKLKLCVLVCVCVCDVCQKCTHSLANQLHYLPKYTNNWS